MRLRPTVTLCLASAALLLAAGCERGGAMPFAAETDDSSYRQGQQLAKQGRSQEALAYYLKVIAHRSESAPESHLEAGLIYLQHIKDPLAAIYHFRKYLELQPNARQAQYVKGLVDTAKREFARTLPAQPLESQAERYEMQDLIDRLQRENDGLKAEVAALRGGVTAPTITTTTRARLDAPAERPPARFPEDTETPQPLVSFNLPASEAEDSPISLATEPEPSVQAAPVAVSRPTPGRNPATPAVSTPAGAKPALAKPTSPVAAAGRRHTVQKGDTLFSIAQRYYGAQSKWRDIYAANRDQLPSENALRLGMELKLP